MLTAVKIEIALELLKQARSLYDAQGLAPTPLHEQVAKSLIARAVEILK